MLFNSFTFFIFFLIFYLLYIVFRKRLRLQNALVLVGSYIFYGWWDERFLLLIAISTSADYITGIGASGEKIRKSDAVKSLGFVAFLSILLSLPDFSENWYVAVGGFVFIVLSVAVTFFINQLATDARNKAWVLASVVVNLSILGYFKYFNFFADSLMSSAKIFDIHIDTVTLDIILPVGISFYTFQTMSYTLDVYRKKMGPTKHFLEHAAFVSFFPQLVAGPIERAKNLLPQFMKPRVITQDAIISGIALFIWGLYKKIVIADNLANISDPIFTNPNEYSSGALMVGALAFTFQIFCDFSGYSDMARALARVMGFELMLNFNIPYISRTPSEFWRRWHISLSSWLKDYLYIPLGGNRGNEWLTYRNLFLTMLLGGLWHGAAWTFIAWGVYQGMILIIYRILHVDEMLKNVELRTPTGLVINIGAWAVMFMLIVVGWILFRSVSFSDAQTILYGIVSFDQIYSPYWSDLVFFIWPLIMVQSIQAYTGKLEMAQRTPLFLRYNTALFFILGIILLSAPGGQEFIYFDF